MSLIDTAVEKSLHSLRRVRNAFAHSTSEVRLADPPYRDRLRESVALARRNLLWAPMELILRKHIAERSEGNQVEDDPGLPDFVLLITILVAFLETAAGTVRPLRPSLSMTFERGISPSTRSDQ